MKYKDFDGTIEELVQMKLKEIEEKENVRILHAIESGSRAWGFASPDSDYDVRFIYMRPMNYYLGLQAKRDYIDWELDETLDINGWDLSKALQHFHKSNATLFEWSNSPVIYSTSPEWENIRQVAERYFSCKSSLYHYYGTANSNYREHLTGDLVKYKKYFYVLRPLLACKWIEQKQCPPPVLFQELVDEVLEENMKPVVSDLLQKKVQMAEADKAPRIDALDDYIVSYLERFKQLTDSMEDDRNKDWTELNELFVQMVSCCSE